MQNKPSSRFHNILAHFNNYWYQLKNFYNLQIHNSIPVQDRLNACLYDSLRDLRIEDMRLISDFIHKTRLSKNLNKCCEDLLNEIDSETLRIERLTDEENNTRPKQ